LGHIGLPIAAAFAESGFQVIGADVSRNAVEAISSGRSHIREPGLSEVIKKVVMEGKLRSTTDTLKAAKEATVVVVCVPTPLTERTEPDLAYLEDACRTVARGLSEGKLVIIQSTLPPATTRDFVAPILERGSGLECGKHFWLAYCPERIAPGKAIQDFLENARVVGGFDQASTEMAAEIFRTVVKGDVLATDCTTAEVAKLVENSYRDSNIAFANEIALVSERVGVDFMEVMRLSNTHPRVKVHSAGCGVGGPCLPKDPYLLLHSVRGEGSRTRVIEASRTTNDFMPTHTVELVVRGMREAGKEIEDSKVAVLGAAYKGGVDDTRNSPSEKIVSQLMALGAEVMVYDPYSQESFGAKRAGDVIEAVTGSDCIVIATDHESFEKLDFGKTKSLMCEGPIIVDGRRILDPGETKRYGFAYYGIGYGGQAR